MEFQILRKFLFAVGVVDYIVVDGPLRRHGGNIQFSPEVRLGENCGVVGGIQLIVGDVLDDRGRFFVVDQLGRLEDKILRVDAEHGKLLRGHAEEWLQSWP